jgi:hypothetical protein
MTGIRYQMTEDSLGVRKWILKTAIPSSVCCPPISAICPLKSVLSSLHGLWESVLCLQSSVFTPERDFTRLGIKV